jgi:hypothetical protein
MPTAERRANAGRHIVILTSLVLAGVALSSLTGLPSWRVELDVLGSPLAVGASTKWLVALLLVALTAVGVSDLVRDEVAQARVDLRYTATFWTLPCLVTLAAAAAVPQQATGDVAGWLASIVLLGLLLAAVLAAEYGSIHLDAPHYRTARLGLNVATYGAAFALYAVVYGLQVRSLLSATAVILVTFPLALELLRGTEKQLTTTWLHAAIIALICGQLTWALNRWGLSALAGGGLLLVVFYTLSGVTQQYQAGRLNRHVVLEFVTIGLIGLAVIFLSSPWLSG